MQEKLLLLLLRLKHSFASGASPWTPMGKLTTLPHTPLSNGEGDPPQTPPNSAPLAPRFPRSTFGALITPHFLNRDYASSCLYVLLTHKGGDYVEIM